MTRDLKILDILLRRDHLSVFLPMVLLSLGFVLIYSSYCIFFGLHEDFLRAIETRHPHLILTPKSILFEKEIFFDPKLTISKKDFFCESHGILRTLNFATGVILKSQTLYPDKVLVSKKLATRLSLEKEETITLISVSAESKDFVIADFFEASDPLKELSVLTPLSFFEELFEQKKPYNRLELQFSPLSSTLSAARTLHKDNPDLYMESWEEHWADTISLFKIEQKLHYFFLGFLVLFISVSTYSGFHLYFLKKKKTFQTLCETAISKNTLKRKIFLIFGLMILLCLFFAVMIVHLTGFLLVLYPIPLPETLFYSKVLPFRHSYSFLLLLTFLLGGFALLSIFNVLYSSKIRYKF